MAPTKTGIKPRRKTEQSLLNQTAFSENESLRQEIRNLSKLHEIGALLNSTLDLDKVLTSVVDAAVSVVSAEEGMLLLADEITGELYVRAQKGLQDKLARELRIKIKDREVSGIIKSKKILRLTSKDGTLKVATGLLVSAIVFIPLIIEEKAIGVLVVDNHGPEKAFTENDERLLKILADYAAVAIRNANLLIVLTSRTNALTNLYSTGNSILSLLNVNEVLKQITQSAYNVLKADIIVLYQYLSQIDEFALPPIICGNVVDPSRLQGRGFIHRRSLIFKLIEKRQPFYASNAQTDWIQAGLADKSNKDFVHREGIASSMGIPLTSNDEMVGIMFVNFRTQKIFSSEEREIVEIFANQAAIAIQNARLFERVNRNAAELSAINRLGQVVSAGVSTKEIGNILKSIYELAARLMEVNNFYVALYDEELGQINFAFAVESGSAQSIGQGEWTSRNLGNGLTEYVILTKKPLLIRRDIDKWLETHNVDKLGMQPSSLLGIPLIAGNKVLGMLGVQGRRENAYDESHLMILETVASLAAIALENARLLDEHRLRLNELSALEETLFDITRELDQEQLLKAIVRRAAELLQAPSGGLFLCDSEKEVLELKYTYNLDVLNNYRFEYGEGVAGRVAQTGKLLIVNDYQNWPERDGRLNKNIFNAVVGAPLIWQEELLGVLTISDTAEGRKFTHKDMILLERFANQATIAIQNARLFNKKVKELMYAYEELKELDKKKTEFLSTVSHELRTPLTPVQSCIENLLGGMYGFVNEKQRSRLEIALAGTREESRLIENLLNLARIQEGKTTLALDSADICKIIHEVVGVFRYDASQKDITIIEEIPAEEKIEMVVDAGKIKQVITNLVSNAIKFTPEKGTITVNARGSEQQVEIRVKDTGIGIPKEEFSKIFERFYQVDSSLTRKVGGTGIGLNIAKEYIEMHGGRIWVENSKLGEGSTFIFTLPIRD